MKTKKALQSVGVSVLTVGASIILGFLSFSGMYAIIPLIQIAFGSSLLSVSYEYEIYLQNINGALNKLFKPLLLKRRLANELLAKILCKIYSDEQNQIEAHPFFSDYAKQLFLLEKLEVINLDPEGQTKKVLMEKNIIHMEKAFAMEVFNEGSCINYDNSDLVASIKDNFPKEFAEFEQAKAKLPKLNKILLVFKILSGLSAAFMALGTTYLLMEAFAIIPFFVFVPFIFWPIIIIPMAVIAGVAYGLLTYNSVCDMILNNPFKEQWRKLREGKLTVQKVFTIIAGIGLAGLAIALTICTAGTWWTVAKEAKPLFSWMSKMPHFIMGIINPIITGFSAIVFNLQNTLESLSIITDLINSTKSVFVQFLEMAKDYFTSLPAENIWQLINPFRLILKLTITPLRIVFFLGHLISIGVTSDRVQGVSEILSAFLGILSEGFEDFHYFVPEHIEARDDKLSNEDKREIFNEHLKENHAHNHDDDFPTRLLKGIFTPIYLLSAGWDYLASKLNKGSEERTVLTFREARLKQYGIVEETFPKVEVNPSNGWLKSHILYCLEHFKQKHAKEDKKDLDNLQNNIKKCPNEEIENVIKNSKTTFFFKSVKTKDFIAELPNKVSLGV